MRINNNLMAMNTHRQYSINNSNVSSSTEKLSSGYRINRAGDDAAGLAISEKMRAQIKGLDMASKNSEDAISLVQTAEGALQETHEILQRMRELATQSASDTNVSIDRDALQEEFSALSAEIDDIANNTQFNTQNLLDGKFGAKMDTSANASTALYAAGIEDIEITGLFGGTGAETLSIDQASDTLTFTLTAGSRVTANGGNITLTTTSSLAADSSGSQTLKYSDEATGISVTITTHGNFTANALNGTDIVMDSSAEGGVIQTGANENETLEISIGDMSTSGLSIGSAAVDSRVNAESAITTVNDAINIVSTERSKLGAVQNRLEHKIANLDTSSENLQAAESRIRDLDMAEEMTEFTKNNILVQASTSMLAQANSAPQGVLSLLQ